jgi:acetyl-CoA carboxylase biotin carboxyl carrier protein
LTDIDSSPEILRRLAEIVSEHNLAQLEVEQDGLQIRIKGTSDVVPSAIPVYAGAPVAAAGVVPASAPVPAPAPANSRAHLIPLESPMVGTFYRAAAPEDPPFIKPGDVVSIGQTIGLIEAMKVYSEVPAEVSGRVVEVVVDNGKLVQMGQPIAFVEPL